MQNAKFYAHYNSGASSSDTQLWPSHFHPTVLWDMLLDHPTSPDFWRVLSPFPIAPSRPDGWAEEASRVPRELGNGPGSRPGLHGGGSCCPRPCGRGGPALQVSEGYLEFHRYAWDSAGGSSLGGTGLIEQQLFLMGWSPVVNSAAWTQRDPGHTVPEPQ